MLSTGLDFEGPRVGDDSVFLHGSRCYLHWPVIAVAERATDLLRGA